MLAALWHAAATWGMQYAMLSLALGGGSGEYVVYMARSVVHALEWTLASSCAAGVLLLLVGRTRMCFASGHPNPTDRPTGEHIIAVRRTLSTQRAHTHTHTVPDQPCGRCGKCHGTQASGGPPSGSGEIFFSPSLVK